MANIESTLLTGFAEMQRLIFGKVVKEVGEETAKACNDIVGKKDDNISRTVHDYHAKKCGDSYTVTRDDVLAAKVQPPSIDTFWKMAEPSGYIHDAIEPADLFAAILSSDTVYDPIKGYFTFSNEDDTFCGLNEHLLTCASMRSSKIDQTGITVGIDKGLVQAFAELYTIGEGVSVSDVKGAIVNKVIRKGFTPADIATLVEKMKTEEEKKPVL